MSFFKQKDSLIILFIYVVPKSSRTEISGLYEDYLKIKLKAPPIDNAANEELVRFLANKLNIPKRNIEIISGHTQKRKTIAIAGINVQLVMSLGGFK